uniref:Uncharacterized protein n=1 Tax=Plectus sambesii TaxID=2011161 RepID=A0A914UTM5_9BILA
MSYPQKPSLRTSGFGADERVGQFPATTAEHIIRAQVSEAAAAAAPRFHIRLSGRRRSIAMETDGVASCVRTPTSRLLPLRHHRDQTRNVRIRPVDTTKAAHFIAPCARPRLASFLPSALSLSHRGWNTARLLSSNTRQNEWEGREEKTPIDAPNRRAQKRDKRDIRLNSGQFEHARTKAAGAPPKDGDDGRQRGRRFARGAHRTSPTVCANLRTWSQMRCADWSPSTQLSVGRTGGGRGRRRRRPGWPAIRTHPRSSHIPLALRRSVPRRRRRRRHHRRRRWSAIEQVRREAAPTGVNNYRLIVQVTDRHGAPSPLQSALVTPIVNSINPPPPARSRP